MYHKNRSKISTIKGFTLIEMMVSVAIFVTVMTVAAGAIISIIDANRKSQSSKSVVDNMHFALEEMARNIRTGSNYSCKLDATDDQEMNCAITGSEYFYFMTQKGTQLAYRFNVGLSSIEISYNRGGSWSRLTAPEVVVNNLRFYVSGAGLQAPDAELQPRVFITVKGTSDPERLKYKTSFNIQTSITQRNLEY